MFPYVDEQKIRIKLDYQKAHSKKLSSKATPIREAVVVIQEDTTMEQLQNACTRCMAKFGIEPMSIYIHKDEGHLDKEGTWKPNLHAHIIFNWYDFDKHATIKLSKQNMSEMQTIFAQCLGMERGQSSDRRHLNVIQQKIKAETEKLKELMDVNQLLEKFPKNNLSEISHAIKFLNGAVMKKAIDEFYPPSDGFFRVRKGQKYNYCDLTGNMLAHEWLDDATDFICGKARIIKKNAVAIINTEGIATDSYLLQHNTGLNLEHNKGNGVSM